MTTPSPRTSWTQKLALFCGAVLFVLAVAEVGLRLAGQDLNRQQHLRYSERYGWLLDPAFTDMDRFNEDGFRGAGTRRPKEPGTKRLLVVGDSFSFAGAQPYELTYPGLLEDWLNRSDESWEVASLSVPDWGTAQELLALEEFGLAFEPDVVILQVFPYNDLCNNTIELANTCGALQDHHRPYFVLDSSGGLSPRPLNPWRARLRSASRVFGVAEEAWIGARRWKRSSRAVARRNLDRAGLPTEWGAALSMLPPESQPPAVEQGWRVTAELFRQFRARCEQRAIPVLAVAIPYFSTFDPAWVSRQELAGIPLDPTYDTRGAEQLLTAAGIETLPVRERMAAANVPPSAFFISSKNGHLSDLGHDFLARWILEELVQRGDTAGQPPGQSLPIAADLLATEIPPGFSIDGLTPIRQREGETWRFGLGPETTVQFQASEPQQVTLSISVVGLFEEQEFGIEINGQPIQHLNDIPVRHSARDVELTFMALPGRNTIAFLYKDWNRRREAYLPQETRLLAVKFTRLALLGQSPTSP